MRITEIEFLNVIKDYINCAEFLCKKFKETYDIKESETILSAMRSGKIPRSGKLDTATEFSFHGGGCFFELPDGVIDIDFGPENHCDGFDVTRITQFLMSRNIKYIESFDVPLQSDIKDAFNALVKKGLIYKPAWIPNPHLYYLVHEDFE